MKFEKKLENIEKYIEIIKKQNIKIDINELKDYFYIKNFFYNYEIPMLKEDFYEVTLEIILNTLKNFLQELEYFVNVKPSSPISISDSEIISKNIKEIEKYHLELHKLYKEYIKYHLTKEKDIKEVISYLEKTFIYIKEYSNFSLKIQDKLILNLDKKIKELNQTQEKITGSMYI